MHKGFERRIQSNLPVRPLGVPNSYTEHEAKVQSRIREVNLTTYISVVGVFTS